MTRGKQQGRNDKAGQSEKMGVPTRKSGNILDKFGHRKSVKIG
jgi:hypothetical protein